MILSLARLAATLILLIVLGASVANGVPGSVGGALKPTANVVTFLDPAGDNKGGSPDITTVRVSNDDAGSVEFQLAIPNRTDLRDGDVVVIYLDIDRNGGTGCALAQGVGVDFILRVGGRTAPVSDSLLLGRDAGGCNPDFAAPQDSLVSRFDSSVLTVRIDRREISETQGFRFFVVANVEPFGSDTWDPAGDTNPWVFTVVVAPTGDATAPRVKALPSAGARGKRAKLRFTVFEESGRAREEITIYRGSRIVAKQRRPFGPRSAAKVYSQVWRVPSATASGLRFCVLAWDAAVNRSPQSCARLTIR